MEIFEFLEETQKPQITPKPWMVDGTHRLVRGTAEMLPKIVDDCIASGLYSLDLETTGLDNRVFNGETVCKIVGVCLSADGITGYYLPLRHKVGVEHNISWSLFQTEMLRLVRSPAIAIFHKGKFDQEFLHFWGGEPFGEWDDPKKFEDTLILAYLRDPRAKQFGLKYLAEKELGMEMIELHELFPEGADLDFSQLDPGWEPVIWYGASDGICTRKLYAKIAPEVLTTKDENASQVLIYSVEKLCLAATRWMERARIQTDQEKARELIRLGQKEWIDCLEEVYKSASEILERDVRPGFYRLMVGAVEGKESLKFDVNEVEPSYQDRVDRLRSEADRANLDPYEKKGKKLAIATITKTVPSLVEKGKNEEVDFPVVYDVLSPQQLGSLLRECKVPGLAVTEKSGQVSTQKDDLDRVLEEQGDKFPFAGKIKRFREVGKALGTYLVPLIEDCAPDGSIKIEFNGHKVDTGRFAAEGSKRPKEDGGTRFPAHGTPATYDPKRPASLARIRECIISRPGKKIVACVAEGELIHTNRGFVPIEKVSEGDLVVTDEGLKAVAWAGYTGTKPVVRLRTDKGIEVRLTRDHLVQTIGVEGRIWKKAGELRRKDWILQVFGDVDGSGDVLPEAWSDPKSDPYCDPVSIPTRMTPSLSEFLGRLMGDGSLPRGEDGRQPLIGISLGSDVSELLPAWNKLSQDLFGILFKEGQKGDSHKWSRPLAEWLNLVTEKGRLGVSEWSVPEAVRTGSSEVHAAFLRGLFDADGHIGQTRDSGITIWITSERMSSQAQILLAGLGIASRRNKDTVSTNYGVCTGYWITIYGNRSIRQFARRIGFVTSRKKERLQFLLDNPKNRTYFESVPFELLRKAVLRQRSRKTNAAVRNARRDGRGTYEALERCIPYPEDLDQKEMDRLLNGRVFFDVVESIEDDGMARVYDLSVPEAGRFSVNSLVVHNCDFAGVELRIVTNLSREPKWVREFFHCSGCDHMFEAGNGEVTPEPPPPFCPVCGSDKIGDLHTLTALNLYGQDATKRPDWKVLRGNGKITNFALCYGGGGNAVDAATGCGRQEGWRIKDQFDKSYTGLKRWWQEQHAFGRQYGYVVTAFGRRYPVPDITSELGGFRSKAERNATNGPIQGTSADITKLSMGLIYKECKKRGWLEKVHLLITMHDELVFEIDDDILAEAIDIFVGIMNRNPSILRLKWPIPLTSDVEIGLSWMVPWDLKKCRKTGEWPPELKDLFPEGRDAKVAPPVEKKVEKKIEKVRVYVLNSFSSSEIEGLAVILAAGKPNDPAKLKVVTPEGDDLTPQLMTAWGGILPEVEAVEA
jgi:DNA polymerase I-like protein with 3'-5' exonuclease and polymerase domains